MASTPDRWLVFPFWPGLVAIGFLGSYSGKRNDNQCGSGGSSSKKQPATPDAKPPTERHVLGIAAIRETNPWAVSVRRLTTALVMAAARCTRNPEPTPQVPR